MDRCTSDDAVRVAAHAALLCVVAASAAVAIPSSAWMADEWDQWHADSGRVLRAMARRVHKTPWMVVGLWILPALSAAVIPYRVAARAYALVAVALSLAVWCAVLLAGWKEWPRWTAFLAAEPAAGYMAHDTLLVLVASALLDPRLPVWALLAGPWMAVVRASASPAADDDDPLLLLPRLPAAPLRRARALLVVVAGAASVLTVLPTQARFIRADGTLFLVGYSTRSFVGTVWSWGMIHVWVVVFHRVAHEARRMWTAPSPSPPYERAVVFLLVGTALVEVYVGAAWAVYAAALLLAARR